MLADLAQRLDSPTQRFLGVATAAVYCGVSPKTIRKAIEKGDLTALRPARGRIVIDRQEIDLWILATAGARHVGGRGRARKKAAGDNLLTSARGRR